MNTNDSYNSSREPGILSKSFHITQWSLLCFAILGNVLVIAWRCVGKDNSKHSLLSVLIVNLAFADFLFCCQFLLREVMLVTPVFVDTSDFNNISFTASDDRLCLASGFLTLCSVNVVALTSVSIALHTYLTLWGFRRAKVVVISVVSVGWVVALVIAAMATYDLGNPKAAFYSAGDRHSREKFSLLVMFGCSGDMNAEIFPAISTTNNVLSAFICCILYSRILWKIRKIKRSSSVLATSNVAGTRNIDWLQVRLAVIAILNLVCWWPAVILYWYSYLSRRTVFNGMLNPTITEPAFILTVAVSAMNPIIYTIASKPVAQLMRRVFHCVSHDENNEKRRGLLSGRPKRGFCCNVGCCKCEEGEDIHYDTTAQSEMTMETSAFDSYRN